MRRKAPINVYNVKVLSEKLYWDIQRIDHNVYGMKQNFMIISLMSYPNQEMAEQLVINNYKIPKHIRDGIYSFQLK